jgi:hypothetical protein
VLFHRAFHQVNRLDPLRRSRVPLHPQSRLVLHLVFLRCNRLGNLQDNRRILRPQGRHLFLRTLPRRAHRLSRQISHRRSHPPARLCHLLAIQAHNRPPFRQSNLVRNRHHALPLSRHHNRLLGPVHYRSHGRAVPHRRFRA